MIVDLASGCTATAIRPAIRRLGHDDFHFNILKAELIMDHSEKLNRAPARHMRATDLDPCPLLRELRMRFRQLAIEQERRIGVEAFLQFVQPRIRIIPWARLVHHKQDFVRLGIVREQIDNADAIFAVGRLRFDAKPLHLKLQSLN